MGNVRVAVQSVGTALPAEAPWRFEQAVKHLEVEEWIDLHWHRRLAFQMIRPLQYSSLPITPTLITMASLVVGVAAGATYYYAGTHDPLYYALGTALLLASIVLDCADGMLARMKGSSSEFGMLLDGLVDFVVGFAVWFGLGHSAVGVVQQSWAWPSMIVLFMGIIAHVAYYDHLKNIYLRLTTPKAQRKPVVRVQPTNAIGRLAAFFYENWYGRMSALICGADIANLEHVEAEDAKRELAKSMQRATWLGVGLHFFVMYVAALAAMAYPLAPFVVAQVGISVVLNVWMVATVVGQRRAARRLRGLG